MDREGNVEYASFPVMAFCPDPAAMSFHYLFDYGQTKSGATLAAGARIAYPVKALEDMGQVFGGIPSPLSFTEINKLMAITRSSAPLSCP